MSPKEQLPDNTSEPGEPDESLSLDLPPEIEGEFREEDQRLLRIVTATFRTVVAPVVNPIHQKITSEHISEVIRGTERHDKRAFDNAQRHRIFIIMVMVIVCVVILGVVAIFLFSGENEFKLPLLTAAIGTFGGLGLGIALKGALG